MAYVKAGDRLRYSVNIEPKGGFASSDWFGANWNDVAYRIANATGPLIVAHTMPPSSDSNILLDVTSNSDRASEQDIKGDIDSVVAAQPEISRILVSTINPVRGSIGTPPGDKPFEMTPAMWAVAGIVLILLLRR
jgi:hypothetical protein